LNILVTGAAGFVGSNLLSACRRLAGADIFALVRPGGALPAESVHILEGDVRDAQAVRLAMRGMDLVFHCAGFVSFQAGDLPKMLQINRDGTLHVMAAALAENVGRVVHLSACAVLGISDSPRCVLDETVSPVIGRKHVYAYSKQAAESVVHDFVRKGLHATIANVATVYGPGDRKMNSGSVIRSIYRGKMKWVPPGGTSYVSVHDLVEGLLLLARKGEPGERYIFCSENLAYGDLAKRIASTLGVQTQFKTVPVWSYGAAQLGVAGLSVWEKLRNPGGVRLISPALLREAFGYKYFSSEKVRQELGWHPTEPLEAAVEKAFAFYRQEGRL